MTAQEKLVVDSFFKRLVNNKTFKSGTLLSDIIAMIAGAQEINKVSLLFLMMRIMDKGKNFMILNLVFTEQEIEGLPINPDSDIAALLYPKTPPDKRLKSLVTTAGQNKTLAQLLDTLLTKDHLIKGASKKELSRTL